MQTLARLITQRRVAWLLVLVTLAVAAASVGLATAVEHDDDLLGFLPEGNSEVGTFFDVNSRFGGLQMALVGIEAAPGEADIFSAALLAKVRAATTQIESLPDIAYVIGVANLDDFQPDPVAGGIVTGALIPELPKTPEARRALREKVLSRDHVVGHFVSADARALLLYCALGADADPRIAAQKVQRIAEETFTDSTLYYGGSPFVSSWIYDTSQSDMRRLTPWAMAVIIFLLVLAFRDPIGSALALISTGIAIIVAMGSMTLAGEAFNVVLGGMPIILFAVGSAYPIHILSRYYTHVGEHGPAEAMRRTLVTLGPIVTAAGLTTVAGLLSFVFMDIQPLRVFGTFTALGIFVALVLALTFVPAAVVLTGLKGRVEGYGPFSLAMGRVVAHLQQRRIRVGVGLLVAIALAAAFAGRVDSRMEMSAFYEAGSPPQLADAFLSRHFGGSEFIQLHLRAPGEGGFKDPHALREMRRLADEVRRFEYVTRTVHPGQVIGVVGHALAGEDRVPDNRAQTAQLMGLLGGQPSVTQILSDDRREALVHVKVDTPGAVQLEALLEKVEAFVADEAVSRYRVAERDGDDAAAVLARLRAGVVSRLLALRLEQQASGGIDSSAALAPLVAKAEQKAEASVVAPEIARFLRSDENVAELPEDTDVDALAKAIAALGAEPDEDAMLDAVAGALKVEPDSEVADDLSFALDAPLREIWRRERSRARADALMTAAGWTPREGGAKALRHHVANALLDLEAPTAMLPAAAGAAGSLPLEVSVTGLPVLHRGISRSVTHNQLRSLAFALILVLIIMTVLFRSLTGGLLGTAPTAITLLVVYGVMGAMGVHLDIGTSMLASLIIGAGVDYAVHLLSAWDAPEGSVADAAEHGARKTSAAIWTNAVTVCAGFAVLTLGDSRPLQNVGALTAGAMITAAVATFVSAPVLARRLRYRRQIEEAPPAEAPAPISA